MEKKRIGLYVTQDLYEWVQRRAKRNHRSMNQQVIHDLETIRGGGQCKETPGTGAAE